jgi:hypothetical protein
MMRARMASGCAVLRRRTHRSNSSRCSALNTNAAFGRRVRIAVLLVSENAATRDLGSVSLGQDTSFSWCSWNGRNSVCGDESTLPRGELARLELYSDGSKRSFALTDLNWPLRSVQDWKSRVPAHGSAFWVDRLTIDARSYRPGH